MRVSLYIGNKWIWNIKYLIFESGQKHLFLDISSANIDTLVPSVRRNPQHRSILTVVSAISSPPFQPLRHQQNVCQPDVNCFTRQTLPTVNRKHFFILRIMSFCPQSTHNITLLFGSICLQHGRHFDYWNQLLNMRMRVCCLYCHEARLCCYLVIHIENLLRPVQLFYFHLWAIYWLFLVNEYGVMEGMMISGKKGRNSKLNMVPVPFRSPQIWITWSHPGLNSGFRVSLPELWQDPSRVILIFHDNLCIRDGLG
jgi:hypothetical protein